MRPSHNTNRPNHRVYSHRRKMIVLNVVRDAIEDASYAGHVNEEGLVRWVRSGQAKEVLDMCGIEASIAVEDAILTLAQHCADDPYSLTRKRIMEALVAPQGVAAPYVAPARKAA